MKNAWIFMAIISLSGCAKIANKEKIAKVDSLIVVVDEAEKGLNQIDMETVNEVWKTSSADLSYLKWASDYTTRKDQFLADAYNSNAKIVKKIQTGYKRTKTEVAYSKSQLDNLRADLGSNVMEDSLFNRYFSDEEKAAAMVSNSVSKLREWEAMSGEKYKSLKPRIDSLRSELEKMGVR